MTVTAEQIAAAEAHGLTNVKALAAACDKYNFRFYHACAILQKESGGPNIYGHDRGGVFATTDGSNIEVTEENFTKFWKKVKAGAVSNGVGPMQITYRGHFPIMAELGLRAWVPAENIEYGIKVIAADYRAKRRTGSSVPQAFQYAATVYNLGHWSSTWPYGLDALTKAAVWKKRVGTADLGQPAPSPVQPVIAPAVEAAVAPAAVHPKAPAAGSRSNWVRVNNKGQLVDSGGFWVTTRGRAMYKEARRLFRQSGGGTPPVITQGGLGSIEASSHTHDREAMDWATKTFTTDQSELWELCTWIVGFAAWRRKASTDWPAHTHGLPKGGDLSSEAKDQVRDFKNARNGLVGNDRYPRISKLGVAERTWKDYRRGYGVSLPSLTKAFAERSRHDDVFELQWALSRHLGFDVVADGDPGPETAKALEKIGPLDAATLAVLGLEVSES